MPFTMQIERKLTGSPTISGEIVQHPFHLGTDLAVAETFVFEQLRQPGTLSVALRWNTDLVRIYDFRDLEGRKEEGR